jgi:hypothetical protein
MNITPFFLDLRSAYQSELDDLAFDSEGRDVLRQRLGEKRKEIGFLVQMMELSPEMVAVIFHQGFRFSQPAVMEQLLTLESHDFPDWDSLADAVQLQPWAQDLSHVVLRQPMGEWFLTVAAALEYMYGRPVPASAAPDDDEHDGDEREGRSSEFPDDEAEDARIREEAGADWLAGQGFDRKE